MTDPDAEFDRLRRPADAISDGPTSRSHAPAECEVQPDPHPGFELIERCYIGCHEPEELAQFHSLMSQDPEARAYWAQLHDAEEAVPEQVIDDLHMRLAQSLPWLLNPPEAADPLSDLIVPPAPAPKNRPAQ